MSELRCGGCATPGLAPLFSLGSIPSVNAFVSPDEAKTEKTYPLGLVFCPKCTLVQLEHPLPPSQLFSHYLHLSSASQSNVSHLREVADLLGRAKVRTLEIGSNDGTLLELLKSKGCPVLGVDPASNLAAMAAQRGIDTICEFFQEETGRRIAREHGPFSQIVALNVVAHTPDFVSLLKGVREALSPGGNFLMEAAYVVDTILRGQFDTIYHEHVYCFSLHALNFAMERSGLRIADAAVIPTQGTSIRVLAVRKEDPREPTARVAELLSAERVRGFTELSNYEQVGARVQEFREELRRRVEESKRNRGKLIGLGAPARGVVILNYCGIGREDLDFVLDDTPLKQGRLVPGVHVPVRDWSALSSLDPGRDPIFLLLSWNYRAEVLRKLQRYRKRGRLLEPFPILTEVEFG